VAGALLHGALASVVELLCEQDLLGRESWPLPAFASAGARGGEPVAGVGDDQFALELARTESIPNIARPRRWWCRCLFDDVSADVAVAQVGAQGDEVLN
jgi:hypothetical protein